MDARRGRKGLSCGLFIDTTRPVPTCCSSRWSWLRSLSNGKAEGRPSTGQASTPNAIRVPIAEKVAATCPRSLMPHPASCSHVDTVRHLVLVIQTPPCRQPAILRHDATSHPPFDSCMPESRGRETRPTIPPIANSNNRTCISALINTAPVSPPGLCRLAHTRAAHWATMGRNASILGRRRVYRDGGDWGD